jgi:NADH-quinone oxidoreductase subunit M
MGIHILFLILLAPVIGALLILLVPENNNKAAKIIAALVAFIALVLSLIAYINYNGQTGGLQFLEHFSWVKGYGIDF